MPRLTRKNIKVFAGSATNNGVFGSLQANNPTTTSDVEQLQSLSAWSEGWNAATETSEELPPLEEIQGVEYVTTYQQAYIMQEGVPEWAATVTYYKGCLTKEVTSTGFKIYNSLTDNNTGNLLSDTSNWKLVMDSDDVYAFDNTVVHKAGAETISGTKTFTSYINSKGGGTYANYATGNQIYMNIDAFDSTNKLTGIVDSYTDTNGLTQTRIVSFYPNDSSKYSFIGATVDANGNASTYAPTPAFNSNDNNIATTYWVKYLFATLFPVGSIYITTQNTGSCPIASLISGSQWELVSTDRALWGGNGWNAHSWIAAGLPNITGSHGGADTNSRWVNGCFYDAGDVTSGGGHGGGWSVGFDASRSSSIYGQSSTVQPPAYRVNVWRRTA